MKIQDRIDNLNHRFDDLCRTFYADASPETIAKVRNLYRRPGTPGEKAAAAEALKRMGASLEEPSKRPSSKHNKFSAAAQKHGWTTNESRISPHADIHWTHSRHSGHTIHVGESGSWVHQRDRSSGYKAKSMGQGQGASSFEEHLNRFHNYHGGVGR